MLIEFSVANFRSFRDEQTLSLVADGVKDKSHEENLIPCGKYDLLKAAAVYGPNASGKSNLFKALSVMRGIVVNSAKKMNLGDRIPGIVPFRLDVTTRSQPTSFELTALVNGSRYVYGFSATAELIHDEWLYVTPPPPYREQRWLERTYNPSTGSVDWKVRGPLEPFKRLLEDRTRENGLALSRGAELNIDALRELYLWFRRYLVPLDMSQSPEGLLLNTSVRISEDERLKNRVMSLVRHADLGLDDIDVDKIPLPQDMPEEIKGLMQDFFANRGEGEPYLLRVRTRHRVQGSKRLEQFDMGEDESMGTQRMAALAGPLLDALDAGAVVVVDELECSMHPLLTRKLLELFQSANANTKGAQLIFATHDTTLMDSTLFRRDQLWLVEKSSGTGSELFSLYDFSREQRPRSTEAFQRKYLAGRYGGVPSFGPIFEDLELE